MATDKLWEVRVTFRRNGSWKNEERYDVLASSEIVAELKGRKLFRMFNQNLLEASAIVSAREVAL